MSQDRVTPMRVAVTGGTGFVGGHLATRLSQQGHQVVLLAPGGSTGGRGHGRSCGCPTPPWYPWGSVTPTA